MNGGLVPVTAAGVFDGLRADCELPEGLAVSEMIDIMLPGLGEAGRCRLRAVLVRDGRMAIVPRARWHRVCPHGGTRLVIQIVGGKGGLQSILSIVVSIASLAITSFFAPGLIGALGQVGGRIAQGLLGMGLTALGGLLIGALSPKQDGGQDKAVAAVTGWRNGAAPDGPVPIQLGESRAALPFAAGSYIEVAKGKVYNRALFCAGLGKVATSDHQIGDTPIAKFKGVELFVGEPGDPSEALKAYPQYCWQEKVGAEMERLYPRDNAGDPRYDQPLEDSPVARNTASDASHAISVFSLGQGLAEITDEGKKKDYFVRLRRRYRMAGSPDWTTLPTRTIRAKRFAGFFSADRIDFPERGAYEIEYMRLSQSEPDEDDDHQYLSACTWVVLQSFRPEPPVTVAGELTLIGVRVLGTAQLQGELDNFNSLAKLIAPDWDAETQAWVERETRWPASHAVHLLRKGKAVPVPDLQIDWPAFQDWHDYCVLKGLRCDGRVDAAKSFLQALDEVAAAGRAKVFWDGRKWTVFVDRPGIVMVDEINPRNARNLKARREFLRNKPHGLRVPFLDRTNEFKAATRIVRWPGHVGDIVLTEELQLHYKTDPLEVYVEARRRMHEMERRAVTYSAERPGMTQVMMPGSGIYASLDFWRLNAHSARVTTVTGNVVAIDDAFEMEAEGSYAIRWRSITQEDTIGTSMTRTVATAAGPQRSLVLTGPGGDRPKVGDLVHFGPIGGGDSIALVATRIGRGADNSAMPIMLPAAPEIDTLTDADKAAAPDWDGRIGVELPDDETAPLAPVITSIVSGVSGTGDPDGLRVLLEPAGDDPVPAATFTVEHRLAGAPSFTGEDSADAAEGAVDIAGYSSGDDVDLRAWAVSGAGVDGAKGPIVTVTIGADDPEVPGALPAFAVAEGNGSALITFATGGSGAVTHVQLYHNTTGAAPPDEATDRLWTPIPVTPGTSFTRRHGDGTIVPLTPNDFTGWSLGTGFAAAGADVAHSGGAGLLRLLGLTLTAGRKLRYRWTVAGYSGSAAARFYVHDTTTGGLQGPNVSAAGTYRGHIIVPPSPNGQVGIQALTNFAGTIKAPVVAYEETAQSLAEGTHYYWYRPMNGPVFGALVGPFSTPIT